MSDWVIVLDSPTGMERKLVRVYLEQGGAYRQIERNVRQEVEVEPYIEANFSDLWDIADPLPEYEWIAAAEAEADSLYRDIARAMIQAAREQNADLVDIVDAAETVIAGSAKSGAYDTLKSLASGATAGQRDNLFLVAAFVALGKTAAK